MMFPPPRVRPDVLALGEEIDVQVANLDGHQL